MNDYKQAAEDLRHQGFSYALIKDQLGIPVSTLSNWLSGLDFTPNEEVLTRIKNCSLKSANLRRNDRLRNITEAHRQASDELGVLTARDIWLLGIGIYIGEGAKTVENVRIANSAPAVIKMSVSWLIEACGLSKNNLRVSLHLYPDCNLEESLVYWQNVTGLAPANFYRTNIDVRLNKQLKNHGKLPYGTATLRVVSGGDPKNGVRLHRKITGWMNSALSQV